MDRGGVHAKTTKHVAPTGEPFFTMSDLLGSKLVPPSPGGRYLACGIHIREGGSTGGSGVHPQFSLDVRGKTLAVAGEGSKAELAAYLRSLRKSPGGAVPLSGPGESSLHCSD